MPQLAPLSWVVMSLFLFFVLLGVGSFMWWFKKTPLECSKVVSVSQKVYFWLW
uniref:ATP synthase F0 subunit 8 n=1 Tax=Zygeupolia rubens TaxID=166045 RepID=I1SR66_9BILA|nr:ATP synthase F0 subunit 8 [Zygeupolia rubens]ADZ05386.1 ATP synthase F0 subunit 8 [Zygeupolia rubens]